MTEDDYSKYWDYFLLIDKDIAATVRYVSHSDDNLKVYSTEFSRLVLTTCAEIDTVSRLLCKEIDNTCDFDDDSSRSGKIDDYCRIILKKYPKLVSTKIYVTTLKVDIVPWDGWIYQPTYHSPTWWNEYQKIKHYRHNNFEKATLENTLFAASSLLVLLMYLHKIIFGYTVNFKTDTPQCFSSKYLLDFNEDGFLEEYNKQQLPDFT